MILRIIFSIFNIRKLILLFITLSLFSCDNVELSYYDINYNKLTDTISINGVDYENMDDDENVLNKISIRPYVDNNSILLSSNEKIFSIEIKSNVKYRFQFINNNVYRIVFLEKNWLFDNNNIKIKLITI